MRINPPLAIVALLAATFGALALNKSDTNGGTDSRCDALQAYLQHVLADSYLAEDGRKLFLHVESVRGNLRVDHLPADEEKSFREHPLYPLYRQLLDSDGVDPRDRCPSIRQFLERPDVRERFTETEPTLTKDEEWGSIFIGVSLPAVSENGQEAIMFASAVFAPLGGGGSEVHLRKKSQAQWIVEDEYPIWIS